MEKEYGKMPLNEPDLLAAVASLPLLIKLKPSQRLEIFCKKLKFCCILCDFTSYNKEIRLKIAKQQALEELTDFVENYKEILADQSYSLSVQMFSLNIFRSAKLKEIQSLPNDEDHFSEKGWTHRKLVYTYFIKMLDSREFVPAKAKKYFTEEFVSKLLNMFVVKIAKERDFLKTILHRTYAKFVGLRGFVRKTISTKLLEAAFEDIEFAGVSEVLEVMGSIINGYVLPFKEEHKQFLLQVLLPLHSSKKLSNFHPQLVYCVIQFIEKDPVLLERFTLGFLQRWPITSSVKECLFLGELEEIIDIMQPKEFEKLQRPIFMIIAKCIKDESYQVCERALYFWENEYIVSLMEVGSQNIFPLILPSLLHTSNFHWNKTISLLANDILQKFMKPGNEHFERIVNEIKRKKWRENKHRQSLNKKWELIESAAKNNPLCKQPDEESMGICNCEDLKPKSTTLRPGTTTKVAVLQNQHMK